MRITIARVLKSERQRGSAGSVLRQYDDLVITADRPGVKAESAMLVKLLHHPPGATALRF